MVGRHRRLKLFPATVQDLDVGVIVKRSDRTYGKGSCVQNVEEMPFHTALRSLPLPNTTRPVDGAFKELNTQKGGAGLKNGDKYKETKKSLPRRIVPHFIRDWDVMSKDGGGTLRPITRHQLPRHLRWR
jgi:hypothetical protein